MRLRAKPKVGWSPVYNTERGFQLPPSLLAFISDLDLTHGRETGLVWQTRDELSAFPSMTKALDDEPRPAHKLALLSRLIAEAKAGRVSLLDSMRRTLGEDQGLTWDLHCAGFRWDREVGPEDLGDWLKAARRLRRRLATRESRRGRTRKARDLLIIKLAHLFDFYYRGPETDRQPLKAEFLQACLNAAGAPGLGFDSSQPRRPSRSRLVRKVGKLAPPCAECIAAGRP